MEQMLNIWGENGTFDFTTCFCCSVVLQFSSVKMSHTGLIIGYLTSRYRKSQICVFF